MSSRKEIAAKTRILFAKRRKSNKTQAFYKRLAARDGQKLVPDYDCPIGFQQVVSSVNKRGNGYFFKSCACSGCEQGETFIKQRESSEVSERILGCPIIKEKVFFSRKKVEIGDEIKANNLIDQF